MSRRFAVLLAALTLLVSGLAHARDYAVEVVVFRHGTQSTAEDARWPAHPPPVQADTPVIAPGGDSTRRLGASELQLGGVRARLDDAGRYEVLAHFGWVQPGWSESRSPHVLVPGGWRPGQPLPAAAGLYGTFQVYAGRYLHVDADLRYRRERQGTIYPMRASRRMRSGELHYLDHPVLGIIIQVRGR